MTNWLLSGVRCKIDVGGSNDTKIYAYVVTHSNAAVNCKYLHDAIPVVTGGNLEEREEGHPKVFKGGVSAHSFAGVVGVTH